MNTEWTRWRGYRGPLQAISVLALAAVIRPLGADSGQDVLETGPLPQPHQIVAKAKLRALATSLEIYSQSEGSYPDSWLEDMYTTPEARGDPPFGPPEFAFDMQGTQQELQGYLYRYTPLPAGCRESACWEYSLTAVPSRVSHLGKATALSFFLDQSGFLRHCLGDSGADASDPAVSAEPVPC